MRVSVQRYPRGGWRASIHVRLKDGTRIRERPVYRDTTKTAAREAANARAAWLMENDGQIDRSKIPTLAAFEPVFIEHLEGRRQKASTIKGNRTVFKQHLVPFFGSKRLDEIDPLDPKLRKHLASYAPGSARNVIAILSKALHAAKRLKLLDEVPEDFDLPKASAGSFQFYTFAEYEALIRAATKRDPRTLVAVLLGGDAGLRAGEIVGLEWPDVSRANGLVSIERQVWRGVVGTPKSGKPRSVPMTPALAAALAAVRHLRGDRVLLQDDGSPLTSEVLRKWMKSAQKLAGLKVTGNVHVLRHTFCSHLAMTGATIVEIKELAGHADVTTTAKYMHLAPGHKEAAIARLRQSTVTQGVTPGLAT